MYCYPPTKERDMAAPTHADAQLMVSLAQWATALGLQDVMPAILSDDFDPDTADAVDDASVRTVLMFGESVGTLAKHDLISTELVHDWLWIEGMWSRVGPAALRAREKFGEPRLYENFEALASS
jgi:hypothetical protein